MSGSLRKRRDELVCVYCGRRTRKPAIDVALMVLCPSCAPLGGMFPGEHSSTRSYDEWKRRAAVAQKEADRGR